MNILITGATSGIGYQLALDYHQQGHRVYACGRNQEALKTLHELGLKTLQVDVTDQAQVSELFADLPPIQLAILAAGTCQYHQYHQFNGKDFANTINTNLAAIGYQLEALWLKLDSPSQLAMVGSLARYLPFTRAGAYSASKAGIWQLANVLRTDLAPRQISVHCIEPGFVDTPMTRANDFKMPGMISVQRAAKLIQKGLKKNQQQIAFPKLLYWLLKVLSILPMHWQNSICRMLAKRGD
ncbi:SDR family NAD(P)-dependent oxidoreductase [Celerinatantimonas yamalensis]|uniref:SDR family NAD(P)-dependent oxidoreductase n=1 Tax=Celerinatantimonas yamalensis TaxID=559956 RepID=A0ABW9G6B8_9GAMM